MIPEQLEPGCKGITILRNVGGNSLVNMTQHPGRFGSSSVFLTVITVFCTSSKADDWPYPFSVYLVVKCTQYFCLISPLNVEYYFRTSADNCVTSCTSSASEGTCRSMLSWFDNSVAFFSLFWGFPTSYAGGASCQQVPAVPHMSVWILGIHLYSNCSKVRGLLWANV